MNICTYLYLRPVGCQTGSCYFHVNSQKTSHVRNRKVTHVSILVYIYVWDLLGARQEVATPKECFFSHLFKESHFLSFNKQTAVVLTPLIPYTRACVVALLFLLCLSPCFLGGGYYTLPKSLWGSLSGIFSGGAAVLRSNNLWSTPTQKSTIETTLTEFHSMLKWVVPSRHGMEQVKCVYTKCPMETVYRHDIKWRQMHRTTMHLRCQTGWYQPAMQSSGTSIGVGSGYIFLILL